MIPDVHIQHEINQRPFHKGAFATEKGKSRSGYFYGTIHIQDSQICT